MSTTNSSYHEADLLASCLYDVTPQLTEEGAESGAECVPVMSDVIVLARALMGDCWLLYNIDYY